MRKTHQPVYSNLKKYIKVAALGAAFVFITQGAEAQKIKEKDVLIDFGTEKIGKNEFIDIYKENNLKDGVIDKKSIEDYLNLYINFKLKVKEAKELGYDTVPAYIEEINGYREQLAKPYFADEKVDENLLKEAYQRKLSDVRASHILFRVDEDASPADTLIAYNKAIDVRNKIEKGASFEDMAVEYSEDPTAKDREAIPGKRAASQGNKGDLGYFNVFDMVYPFESAAYNLNVGEVSKPVRTRFGYHLIKVTDKQDALGICLAAHIYVSSGDNSAESQAKAQEKINQISEKIKGGMSWNEAVNKFSEDRNSAVRNGLLQKFSVNRMIPSIVEKLYDLDSVNNISEPVSSTLGWHIFKLVSRTTPKSYDEELNTIKTRISRDQRSLKSKEAVVKQLLKENKYKLYKKNEEVLFAKLLADTLFQKGMLDTLNYADSKATNLFKFAKKKYPESLFIDHLLLYQSGAIDGSVEIYLRNAYKNFIEEFAFDYENKHLEAKYPDFKKLINKYRDGILLFNLSDDMVWSKAISDTTGLKAFYEAHKGDYLWPERVEAMVFTVNDPKQIDKVREIAAANNDPKEIQKLIQQDSTLNVNIQTDKFAKKKNAYVDEVKWTPGISKNFDDELGKSIVFVKVLKVIPSGSKKLDEAKGIITADYQNYLEKEWVKELREKYPVKVNETLLEKIEIK